ncbi:MAG: hypothetical protein OHK0046_10860 [Anaerolineae bacterium]
MRYFPIWVLLVFIFVPLMPRLLGAVVNATVDVVTNMPRIVVSAAGDVLEGVVSAADEVLVGIGDSVDHTVMPGPSGELAPLFTAQIDHWEDDILRWSAQYDVDPNLLATVMQIESCGHPTVSSVAGAQGLFQVMPFHFSSDENQLDPDTNAMRGANFLNYCLDYANGDTGLAMACYNGGPSVVTKPFDTWHNEPQRYFRWGTGIYNDALNDSSSSDTLNQWLAAGGQSLCDRASFELGLN